VGLNKDINQMQEKNIPAPGSLPLLVGINLYKGDYNVGIGGNSLLQFGIEYRKSSRDDNRRI